MKTWKKFPKSNNKTSHEAINKKKTLKKFLSYCNFLLFLFHIKLRETSTMKIVIFSHRRRHKVIVVLGGIVGGKQACIFYCCFIYNNKKHPTTQLRHCKICLFWLINFIIFKFCHFYYNSNSLLQFFLCWILISLFNYFWMYILCCFFFFILY